MRTDVKKQLALRVLSSAAVMAIITSCAASAFAATYDLTEGSVDIVAENGTQYITQKDENGGYVSDDQGVVNHREDTNITLTTKDEETGEIETTKNTVTITAEEGNTANVTLDDVHIETKGGGWSGNKQAPITVKGDGDTNIELNGDNTVLSGSNSAGIEKADSKGTGTLTIKDDVNDDGSEKNGDENDTTGKLFVAGYYNGAGIGGGGDRATRDSSNITITGGEIIARGGCEDGAGIGGGNDGTGKNIRIEGNAHVTATGDGGAGIGGGTTGGNSVTITGDAVVDAYSEYGGAIGDGRPGSPYYERDKTTDITISGNATVNAEGKNGAVGIGSGQNGNYGTLNITIEENADVTAVGSINAPAIGNAYNSGTTNITITGGTVNAINSYGSRYGNGVDYPAIGSKLSGSGGELNLTINSTTGNTVVNAYLYGDNAAEAIGTSDYRKNPETGESERFYTRAEGADYNEDGSSKLGEKNSAVINYYRNASVTKEKLDLPDTLDEAAKIYPEWNHHCTITGGELYKVVHNRKYMEENPEIDTSNLEESDLHDWQQVGETVEPTLESEGYADYICSIDKCGQTLHKVLPKLTPEPTPDTPDDNTADTTPEEPDDTPTTPDAKPDTPAAPDTPADAPVQDATADTTPADSAMLPGSAQNPGVLDAKPDAAVTPANAPENANNPAVQDAKALPQTGSNWLAVLGTALSGVAMMAVGFFLNRKRGENR